VASVAAVSKEKVHAALEPVVTGAGYDLEDVTVTAAGRRSVVRVVVDRDGGVDLDAVAEISRLVSDTLDARPVTGDVPYTLEVSSPGVDRPLTEPRHWRRAAGRLVQVTAAGAGTVTGRVVAADDTTVTLAVDGVERTFPLADLGPGHVQVEFSRADAGEDPR
jgi:ribosome maturation factor RimP